jgi:NADH-quinone oxidoreductase subunit A
MATPTSIAAYLVLFATVAVLFVFANLTLGRLLRPKNPSVEKGEIYECGETVIGSSFVQFDIRFYVVALLFIVFDVEVAFFFPWAVVFGKATHLVSTADAAATAEGPAAEAWNAALVQQLNELGMSAGATASDIAAAAQMLTWGLFADILVFFAVLMVGFAYVWSRGDLNWVRTTVNAAPGHEKDAPATPRAA